MNVLVVSAQQNSIIQITAIAATCFVIIALVAFEFTPPSRRKSTLKVLLPALVVLGLIIVAGAMVRVG